MKKLFLAVVAITLFQVGFSQTTSVLETPAAASDVSKPKLSKEERAVQKVKQEADLNAAFKEAGLDDKQAATAKEIMAEATKKNYDLKTNPQLTDTEKEIAKKAINEDKNAKLKTLMGDKYKAYIAIRKKQKEANTVTQKAD